jgi:hypothetical protein
MHKFIFSDILQNHGDGVSNFSRISVAKMSPNSYFVHSKRHLPEEYHVHPAVTRLKELLLPFIDGCDLSPKPTDDWDLKLYTESTKDFWQETYKSQNNKPEDS